MFYSSFFPRVPHTLTIELPRAVCSGICDLADEKGNRKRTRNRLNAFESRLNAFAYFHRESHIHKTVFTPQHSDSNFTWLRLSDTHETTVLDRRSETDFRSSRFGRRDEFL